MKDGAYKIVFNTQGTKGDICKSVLAFLRLIEGESSDDPFVMQLEAAAEEIKADEKWREAYMQSKTRDQDRFDAGVEQGESRKEIEIAEKMIRRGDSIDDIMELTDLSEVEIKQLKGSQITIHS